MRRSTKLLLYVAAGSFMVIFDGSAFQMTLPVIRQSLGGTIQEVQWTMTAFLLVSTSTLLQFGRAGDVLGRERVWRSGIVVFAAASTLSAMASSLPMLILARAVQGAGAAMTTANSAPILVDAFPQKGGRMLGLGNIALALGMVAGPPLGALLTEARSWRLIFLIAVPLGSAVWLGSRQWLPRSPRLTADLDLVSGLLSTIGLAAILLGATFGHRWGWLSVQTLAPMVTGAAILGLFFWRQAQAPAPLIELSLLRQPMFVSGLLSSFFGFAALFIALAVLPYLLLVSQQRDIAQSGVLVGILPLVLSITAPAAGVLADKVGSRSVCALGLLALGAALLVILAGGPRVGAGRLLWALALAGAGLGGFEAPNGADVLRSLPRERLGAGMALMGAVRSLGMTFGAAAGGTLLDYATENAWGTAAQRTAAGARWALGVAAASALLGAVSVLIRPAGRPSVRAMDGRPEAGPRYSELPKR
jgi:EmrB/QacA subfamily drug resistance transporter